MVIGEPLNLPIFRIRNIISEVFEMSGLSDNNTILFLVMNVASITKISCQ